MTLERQSTRCFWRHRTETQPHRNRWRCSGGPAAAEEGLLLGLPGEPAEDPTILPADQPLALAAFAAQVKDD